jgi:hypothetical protein
MDEDDDVLTAMAHELVTRQGVGERAAEVWKALTKGRETEVGAAVAADSQDPEPIEPPAVEEPTRLWTPRDAPAKQLSLF